MTKTKKRRPREVELALKRGIPVYLRGKVPYRVYVIGGPPPTKEQMEKEHWERVVNPHFRDGD